jgi:propionyl-CoA carboxylase alpha chain
MPGSVSRLGAQVGDSVTAGQPIVWMEAMKMEHAVTAPTDGVLTELDVQVGQQVDLGAVLARVEPPSSPGGRREATGGTNDAGGSAA